MENNDLKMKHYHWDSSTCSQE